MLFEGLDRIKRTVVLSTIVLMIVGNVMLILPESILPFVNEMMGFALLVVTVVSIFSYLASKKALIHYIYLTIGLLCGILGICLLVFEGLLTNILIWTVCIFPVISGLYGIYHALVFARRSGRKGWWILIILSLAMIVFGGFTPLEMRTTLEDLGPTYVKIGQIMSSRTDILPQSYCRELEKLRSEVKPLAASDARKVIEEETGRKIEDIYQEFRDEPLGSASIAQAHYGVLKDGTRVVTKVQRP